MTTQPRENERRDSVIIIILILLLGFICIILASGWALRFAPNWKLNTNMGSNLDPNSDFLTSRPVSFFEPLDPAILTQPVWMNSFLTPGAANAIATRTPLPAVTTTLAPVKTSTPIPTTITATKVASPTNTLIYIPPTSTRVTPKPPPTNTPVTPLPSVDLRIAKTDGSLTYTPGTTIIYTIMVSNAGPSNAIGASIADTIPASIIGTIINCVASGTASCGTNASAGNNLSYTGVNIPAGAGNLLMISVSGTVNASATGNLVNTATVTVGNGQTDPIPGNNSATDVDTANSQTNLVITKTDGSLTYTAGAAITYTIVVSNAGPSNAIGASVTDAIPASITGTTINCVASGTASCGTNASSGNSLSYTGVSIFTGAGNFLTITVNGTVNLATTGNLVNTATVTEGTGQTDAVPSNNSATDTDTQFIPSADLQITKTDGVTTYTAGGNLMYTITVSNPSGPNNVVNATVTDNFPAQVASATWTCSGAAGGACAVNGSGNINDNTVDLPVGASVTYIVNVTTASSAAGILTNTATISGPAVYTETNPLNNSATDTDTPVFSSDMGVSITDNATGYIANQVKTYTLVVSNAGPSDATGATVTNIITPIGNISAVNWTCTPAVGAVCAASGNGDINDNVNIPAGATVTYTITVTVSAAPSGSLTSTAMVSLPTDPNNSNNSATDIDYGSLYGNIGSGKDGSIEILPSGSNLVLALSPQVQVNGHPGPDIIYYEQGVLGGIDMDQVILEIGDGTTWYSILNWGDTVPDIATNIAVPLPAPNPTTCALEPDNCFIDASFLDLGTGITIDLDNPSLGIPAGTYPFIRIRVVMGGSLGIDGIYVVP